MTPADLATQDFGYLFAVTATGLIGIAVGIRKVMSFWKAEGVNQATSSAFESQFKSLRDQIEGANKQILELRKAYDEVLKEMSRMDAVIHRQQTKLTRTEMLLRQFVALVRGEGIDVPNYMQQELEDLLAQDKILNRDPNDVPR